MAIPSTFWRDPLPKNLAKEELLILVIVENYDMACTGQWHRKLEEVD